ncbi:MAG: hypothetical protein PHG29_11015 [Prolixibacteraceae bacterium]|nr:hypothetical protein [Prolixibacteraceae bacterium]
MNTKYFKITALLLLLSVLWGGCDADMRKNSAQKLTELLSWDDFSEYIKEFNNNDEELYVQYYPDSQAEDFLKKNIPLFQCPDAELEKTYYFRWWTFRKHIKYTPDGFVITEFLPDVSWAGKHNTINCPAGHHFYEGRWLHNPAYLRDYANFWFKGGGSPRSYSFWAPNSILAFASVHNDHELITGLLPFFISNYESWENERLCDDGLFWQIDDRDGMEVSVGGSGKRATINSYMTGDAEAIARIAEIAGNMTLANEYSDKAAQLKKLMLATLWDEENDFFKTLPLNTKEIQKLDGLPNLETFTRFSKDNPELVDVRELHGYTPWYFNIPEEAHSIAWKFMLSTKGFKAPYGPTTAEQSHPEFKIVYEGHACQWNGPGWPFATTITIKAMANLLRNYNQKVVSKDNFMELLLTYSNSHRRINEKGKEVCWIDENLNPFTGDWIARTMLKSRGHKPAERGKDYNHSAFCDFIISDLVGIRPSMNNSLTIHPLVPDNYWDWFCLDRVKYHDKMLTVIWDKEGTKYKQGKGFSVFIDGQLKHNSSKLEKINIQI